MRSSIVKNICCKYNTSAPVEHRHIWVSRLNLRVRCIHGFECKYLFIYYNDFDYWDSPHATVTRNITIECCDMIWPGYDIIKCKTNFHCSHWYNSHLSEVTSQLSFRLWSALNLVIACKTQTSTFGEPKPACQRIQSGLWVEFGKWENDIECNYNNS